MFLKFMHYYFLYSSLFFFALNFESIASSSCSPLYKIQQEQCFEICFPIIEPYTPKYHGFTKGTCDSQGFTSVDHEERPAILFSDFSIKIYKKPTNLSFLGQENNESCEKMYKIEEIERNVCLEFCLDPAFLKFFRPGGCKDQGYRIFDHSEQVSAGQPFGDISVDYYRKAIGDGECHQLYKIIDEINCAQACVDQSLVDYIKDFAREIQDGSCLSQNYIIFDHSTTIDVGPFGTLELDLFRKQQEANS